jgi:hypothetical protein
MYAYARPQPVDMSTCYTISVHDPAWVLSNYNFTPGYIWPQPPFPVYPHLKLDIYARHLDFLELCEVSSPYMDTDAVGNPITHGCNEYPQQNPDYSPRTEFMLLNNKTAMQLTQKWQCYNPTTGRL